GEGGAKVRGATIFIAPPPPLLSADRLVYERQAVPGTRAGSPEGRGRVHEGDLPCSSPRRGRAREARLRHHEEGRRADQRREGHQGVPGPDEARLRQRGEQGGQGVHDAAQRGDPGGGQVASSVLRRAASNLVEGLLLAMMVLLCADVFLGVFSRYVLRSTFTWYDEIARLLFVWIVFLGAAVGVKRGAHFRLHLLTDRFPPPARRAAA